MSMEYCHEHHNHYDTDWDLECHMCFDEIEDEADELKLKIDKMKKQWTNYELAIVFYYVKFGSTFGIKRGITLPFNQLVDYVGHGEKLIAMDAHIDTVGVGNMDNWDFDPYEGYEDDEVIGGRGASDQEGGMASMVYAGKIIKDLGLEDDYTLLVTGTVQEEDCDGLCWQYIIKELGLKPEFVVSTEPTDGGIYRGQRGRMVGR